MKALHTVLFAVLVLLFAAFSQANAACTTTTIFNNGPCDVTVVLTDDWGYEYTTVTIPNNGIGVLIPAPPPPASCWVLATRVIYACGGTIADISGILPGTCGVTTALPAPFTSADPCGCDLIIQ